MCPRPKKIRQCQGNFCGRAFKPTGTPFSKLDRIELYRDELEALRLCDRDGLTQEEAGQFMGVSRGTIQRIVSTARKKLATALSEGKAIVFVDDEEPESESEPQQEPEGH
jgi:predicted DNA-binding protein (UPF0251 family)